MATKWIGMKASVTAEGESNLDKKGIGELIIIKTTIEKVHIFISSTCGLG